MDELNAILKPTWNAEKWILEGWNTLSDEEKNSIKQRMDEVFKEGLPFELKHDPLIYIYTFSLCAQLECLGMQVPLRFAATMPQELFQQQMRAQLVDEIFHTMLFTKIVYILCAPAAFPPAFSPCIELFCNFFKYETCPKVGVVLMNLVFQGWSEVFLKSLDIKNIAPKVFSLVMEAKRRHLREADLYIELGLPEKTMLQEKLATSEGLLFNCFMQDPKYFLAFSELIGKSATGSYFSSLNDSHIKQLKKIKTSPSKKWQLQMQIGPHFYTNMLTPPDSNDVVLTPIKQMSMTQWNEPGDPTMVGLFNIDVGCLGLFDNKYPSETLTTLMLQAISLGISGNPSFRTFLSCKKMYQSQNAYVAVVVKLPHCGDHIGSIIFKDCHEISASELALKIRQVMEMMVYCFKTREEMERVYPELKQGMDAILTDWAHGAYPYPIPGNSFTSVSNIGFCGFEQAISPMRKQEAVKFTLLTVRRKPVWNNVTKAFEGNDLLPVSMSADHRVFDGNIPIPKLLSDGFQHVYKKMMDEGVKPIKNEASFKLKMGVFKKMMGYLLETDPISGYQMLVMLQTNWLDFMAIGDFFMHTKVATSELEVEESGR